MCEDNSITEMTFEALLESFDSQEERTYLNLLIIRKFEENLLKLFEENKLFGTTHTCIGQEAIAVAAMECISEKDIVFSNHRCHGHFISYSKKPELLLKEIMGKSGGVCDGRGGSQHIHYKNFYTNGVQGGIVPNAVGAAWAEKLRGTSNIAVVFLGDGTLGQGVVYECLNIASLKEIPVLFVVEENGYAMSTATREGVGGEILGRPKAFGVAGDETEGNNIDMLRESFQKAVSFVRNQRKPFMLVAHTYRLAAHSKGDDFRDEEEIRLHREQDPLKKYETRLNKEQKTFISQRVQEYMQWITAMAEEESFAELPLSEVISPQENLSEENVPEFRRYIDSINYALNEAVTQNTDVVLLGEDIRDPYGGAFKATKGISTEHGDQVFNMPISEAAMAGVSVGLALNGIHPITEIMFGDFITLAMDQIINHASKYRWIYGKHISLPMVIRAPMGGKRGYGPTHSQSLEKYLVGIPDIHVIALSVVHDPVKVYRKVMKQSCPVVVIENKLLYSQRLKTVNRKAGNKIDDFYVRFSEGNSMIPVYELSLNCDFSGEVTLITYGGLTQDAMLAATQLMIDEEIGVNVVVLGELSNLPWEELKKMVTTPYVITVEEGTMSFGIGAEIIAGLSERQVSERYVRIASPDLPIPNSLLLEKQLLPDTETMINKVREVIHGDI